MVYLFSRLYNLMYSFSDWVNISPKYKNQLPKHCVDLHFNPF